MSRLLFWAAGGLVLGGLIHLIVIITLPDAATRGVWNRLSAIAPAETLVVIDDIGPNAPNPLGLDPELLYGVCRLELNDGPGIVSGPLPLAFWSVAVFNPSGHVIYSTTNRDGIGLNLDLGIFNAAQTRLLAQQQLDVAEGLLIVESPQNNVFALVRLAPPHPAMQARYAEALSQLECGNIQ